MESFHDSLNAHEPTPSPSQEGSSFGCSGCNLQVPLLGGVRVGRFMESLQVIFAAQWNREDRDARRVGPIVCRAMRWFLGATLLLLLLGFGSVQLRASDSASAFDQANKLYEQGKYSEAVPAFKKLVEAGSISAPLYFNLGNALFKSGRMGEAIVSYRLAERLAPRDPDIKANLRFARDTIQSGAGGRRNRWSNLVNVLTLDELALITVGAVWIWMTLLMFRQLRPSLLNALSGYTATAGVVSLLLGAWLGLAAYMHLKSEAAVVVVPEVVVRYGPLEESQSFYTLRDGAELTVLDRKEAWLRVKDASQRIGWVQSRHVELIPPG
jgi:tetratricopeptide (TPR) repeat protein